MKLKDLRSILNKLTKEQLDQELIAISDDKTQSCCASLEKSKTHLIYDGNDDPSELRSRKELIEDGYSKEEIEEMEIAIKKGEFYIEVNMSFE